MARHVLVAFAAAITLACAGGALAQGFNPRDVAGATELPAANLDFSPNRRTPLPPDYQGTPRTRVCAWRPDGQTVTSAYYRGFPGDVQTCSVSQDAEPGSRCRCGGRRGNVIETPFA
jgi:hypothetical protein